MYHGAIQVTPFRNKEYIKKFNKNYSLGADSKLAGSLGYVDPNIQIKKQNMIDFALGFIKIIDEHIKTTFS